MRITGIIGLAVASSFLAVEPGQAQDPGDPVRGAVIARSICSECHAVERDQSRSPNRNAPAFIALAASPGMTALAVRVWLQSPHPTMPNLILSDHDKDNVIAFILSLKGGAS
jgi:mono/diheme cytochrome c family protein